MSTRVLVVEDDEHFSKLLINELTHEGYEVIHAVNGRDALNLFNDKSPDLVLLDVMLPEINGFEVLRRIRLSSSIPVILETARDETFDKVNGLYAGADDYISKPFDIEELLARIAAVLRRFRMADTLRGESQSDIKKAGNISLNTDTMKVTVKDNDIELTRTEFFLLKYFMENKGKALSRNEIIDDVWGKDHYIDSGSVDVYVRFLRSKISEHDDFEYIKTIRGTGYVFNS